MQMPFRTPWHGQNCVFLLFSNALFLATTMPCQAGAKGRAKMSSLAGKKADSKGRRMDGWMGEREGCMKEGGRESERDRKERVGRSSDFLAEARD